MADLHYDAGCYGAFSDAKGKQILAQKESAQIPPQKRHLPAISCGAP